MASVVVDGDVVRLLLTRRERLLAAHGREVVILKRAITAVEAVPDILAYRRGLRLPGTGLLAQ